MVRRVVRMTVMRWRWGTVSTVHFSRHHGRTTVGVVVVVTVSTTTTAVGRDRRTSMVVVIVRRVVVSGHVRRRRWGCRVINGSLCLVVVVGGVGPTAVGGVVHGRRWMQIVMTVVTTVGRRMIVRAPVVRRMGFVTRHVGAQLGFGWPFVVVVGLVRVPAAGCPFSFMAMMRVVMRGMIRRPDGVIVNVRHFHAVVFTCEYLNN